MSSELLELVRSHVLSQLKEHDADSYEELHKDTSKLDEIHTHMKDTFNEAIHILDNSTSLDEAFAFAGEARKHMFKTSLRMQSFNVEFTEVEDDYAVMYTTMAGQPMTFMVHHGVRISTITKGASRIMFVVRIILECVILLLNLVGFGIPTNGDHLETAVKTCSDVFTKSETLMTVINGMLDSYNKHDFKGVAKSILQVLKELFTGKAISKIVKSIWNSLSWFDLFVMIVKALTFIATAVFTGMIATVARIISWVIDGAEFLLKLRDLIKLGDVEKRLAPNSLSETEVGP